MFESVPNRFKFGNAAYFFVLEEGVEAVICFIILLTPADLNFDLNFTVQIVTNSFREHFDPCETCTENDTIPRMFYDY